MTRANLAAILALALAGAGCTKTQAPTAGAGFRQPSAVAVFRGVTIADVANPTNYRPYLAVANQARNDLSMVDGVSDTPVAAPIQLRTVQIPVLSRPALVAAASLGDDGPTNPTTGLPTPKPDLLVAVASGSSVLQLVETWNTANLVHSDPAEAPTAFAVDLGHDVLALTAVPAAPGTAVLAAALADHRIALVSYRRGDDGKSVVPVPPAVVSGVLPFQPAAIAAMPGDAAATSLFAATLDAIGTDGGGNPLFGVEEISVPGLVPVTALGARGPTRLVAAARLQERIAGADATGNPLPGSAASDETAFANQPVVRRVYAVLDESGCGVDKPIDCGIVTLDPAAPSGTQAIPQDDAVMPYRAPMRVLGRPLGLAVSPKPAKGPPRLSGEPDFSPGGAAEGYMRLYSESVARATTAVAAVPSDNGSVYFLDLGRFETATSALALQGIAATAGMPTYARPPTAAAPDGQGGVEVLDCTKAVNERKPACAGRRIWLRSGQGGGFLGGQGDVSTANTTVTPGFTPDQQWSLSYQGELAPSELELHLRAGEAGQDASGVPWVALQDGVGGGRFNQVVRLWDPRLGVAVGDLLALKASGVGCVGTPTGVSTNAGNEFLVQVLALLPPTDAYPGGAVSVGRVATEEDPAWPACYAALVAKTQGGAVATGLVVTVRAGGYVLTGVHSNGTGTRVDVGYAGRPTPDVTYRLQYQDEDALSCPFDRWDGTVSTAPDLVACDATCRSGCEKLAIARKLRRYQGISVDCDTNSTVTSTCQLIWPDPGAHPSSTTYKMLPLVKAPVALEFTFGLDREAQPSPDDPTQGTTPFRELKTLLIGTTGGVTMVSAVGASTAPYQANHIVAFDRSPWTDPTAGYRFLVTYPADFVLDTTPSQGGAPSAVIK